MVLNKILKLCFALVGALTGYTLVNVLIVYTGLWGITKSFQTVVYIVVSLAAAFLFYKIADGLVDNLSKSIDGLQTTIQKMSSYELMVSTIGLIVGLIVANLITIPIVKLSIIGVPLAIIVNIMLGSLGIYLAIGKRNELIKDIFLGGGKTQYTDNGLKVVDTSVLIDGRIVDIIKSGFMHGELIIPGSVLVELRHIADSEDPLKRSKGRRGLDILNIIQTELGFPVTIDNDGNGTDKEVDNEILDAAEKHKCKILTVDYNLNKVAGVRKIRVLNINDLANSVKPIALPGEKLAVHVIKEGKEDGQGIGYMEDGTMIVVEGGRTCIGETVDCIVTSILQTSAGRMVFAKK